MIPLIVTDAAVGKPAPPAATDGPAMRGETAMFGDVFAMEDETTTVSLLDGMQEEILSPSALLEAEEGEITVGLLLEEEGFLKTGPDAVILTPSQPTQAPPLRQPAARLEGDALAHPGTAVLLKTEGTAEKGKVASGLITDEKIAVTRTTVAQSVLEGRLSQVAPVTEDNPVKGEVKPVLSDIVRAPVADAAKPNRLVQTTNAPASSVQAAPALMALTDDLTKEKILLTARSEVPLAEVRQTPVPQAPTAPTSIATPPPAVALAQFVAVKQEMQIEGRGVLVEREVAPSLVASERSVPSLQSLTAAAPIAGVETARHVASQISVAVTNNPGKITEIALNPEELGRVRLSMTAADGVITLNVLAERPETQDLLRRHIDVLGQEFRDLGYESISFSFGAGGQSDAPAEAGTDSGKMAFEPDDIDLDETPTNTSPTSGLDLRL